MLSLTVVGGGDVLTRAAREFPPPRVQALRQTAFLTLMFTAVVSVLGAFVFTVIVPSTDYAVWRDAPLVGIAQHLAAPLWLRDALSLALVGAAVVVLLPAAYEAVRGAERMLHRASIVGVLPRGLSALHTRFGTPLAWPISRR